MQCKIFTLEEIVRTARAGSAFYADLYRGMPETGWTLEQLPIVDQEKFWAANASDNNKLLTGPMKNGIVFKSGGTTGNPKFSVFTTDEWRSFTEVFGQGLAANGLRAGERVANVFYAGDLYASFLFITFSLHHCPTGAVQFPIAGSTPVEEIIHLMRDYRIDVIAGVPTTILEIGEYVAKQDAPPPAVRKILYGGESIYPDQRAFLQRVMPGVKIVSIGYASVDAGLLGYADEGCLHEEHRVFGQATLLEIVDEDSGEVIHEQGRPGKILITNLTRRLMPIIRYPAGDRAIWIEPETSADRKFLLLGRSSEAARVGPMSLYVKDIHDILSPFWERLAIVNFQICIEHRDKKDSLVIRIVSALPKETLRRHSEEIIADLRRQRPMYGDLLDSGKINPAVVEWIGEKELTVNPRTGKLRVVVDNRLT